MDDVLPKTWKTVKLGSLLSRISNGANVKQYEEKVGLPISRIETIWNEKVDYDRVKYIKEDEEEFINKYKLHTGDILLSHINSDSHLGKTALFKDRGKTLIHGINLLLLRSKPDVSSKYLNYYIRFFKHKGGFYKIAQRAVNQSSVNQKKIKDIDVILPPLPTQNHIVEKIEELFSELDNGVENLKKAHKQLKTYRQAVLKDAFEGKLTKEWREKEDGLPTPAELLQHIKAERKAHRDRELAEWEKEVEQWEKDGEPGRKSRKPRKQKDLDPIKQKELEKLSELPTEWIWIKFGEVFKGSPQNGLYKPKSDYGSGHEIVRIDNFYDGKMTGKLKKVKLSEDEISKYRIKSNNLLINRVNSLPYLGKCGLVTDKYSDSVFESNVMKVELSERIVVPKLLAYYLSSQTGTTQIRKNAKHAVNQASINQIDVANTLIPLTSVQEQGQILNEIESRLSVVDQLEQSIEDNLQKAEALRQSILMKAFGGELVEE